MWRHLFFHQVWKLYISSTDMFLTILDCHHTCVFSQDELDALQGELDRIKREQQSQIEALESQIQESSHKHQEEVAFFQKLLKEREESDRQRESERERLAEVASAKESSEEVCRGLEAQLEALRTQLETIQEQRAQEIAEGQDGLQKELTDAQQEVENLKEELAQKNLQHEEEMRALEEDFEIERDRLLLLQEELTEQLALKGIAAHGYQPWVLAHHSLNFFHLAICESS